jgi:hypothetical protein
VDAHVDIVKREMNVAFSAKLDELQGRDDVCGWDI